MRFRSLQISAYGKFASQSLAFPEAPCVMVVYGPNEAGKSTVRQAITDFLYGVPRQPALAYQFPRSDISMTAEVDFEGTYQSLLRNTKARDTLLQANGSPVEDHRWHAALGMLDRAGFVRMFALGRDELVEGAEQMLRSGDEAGRLVFEAAAGLTTFAAMSTSLGEDAARAYSPRGASTDYALAKKRLDAASAALKAQEHREPAYRALQKKAVEAQEALDALVERRKALRIRFESGQRILRVLPQLRAIAALEASVAGDAPPAVPPDLPDEIDRLCTELQRVEADQRRISTALDKARADHARVMVRDEVLAVDSLEGMNQQRGEIAGFETDIAKVVGQREKLRPEIDHELGALGLGALPVSDLHALLPSIPLLDAVKRAAAGVVSSTKELGALRAQHEQHAKVLQEVTDKLTTEVAGEVTALRNAVLALEAAVDLTSMRSTREQLASNALTVSQRYRDLDLDAEGTLRRDKLPTEQEAREAASTVRDHTEQRHALRRALTDVDQSRAGVSARISQLSLKDLPTREDLHVVRQQRDDAFDPMMATPSPEAVAGYRQLVHDADALSDRRFESAAAAQELDQAKAELAAVEARREQILSDGRAAAEVVESTKRQWSERCQQAGMPPIEPDAYDGWRQRLREADASASTHAARREKHEAALSMILPRVLAVWHCLDVPVPAGGADDPVAGIEAASDEGRRVLTDRERQASVVAALTQQVALAQQRLDTTTAKVRDAEEALEAALRHLRDALKAAGMSPDLSAEAALESDRRIEALRSKARDFNNLDDGRIKPMRFKAQAFKERVSALAGQLAVPEGSGWEITLDRMLTLFKEQEELARRRKQLSDQIVSLEAELTGARKELQDTTTALSAQLTPWGAADVTAFRDVVRARSTWDQTTDTLQQRRSLLTSTEGGRTVESLRAEAEGVDEDALKAEVLELVDQTEDSETPYQQAVEAVSATKRALAEVTGSDAAAQAKGEFDSATLALNRALDTYLQYAAEQLLLDWAIARFREDQQSPLLAAAERYLRILTRETYTRLIVDEGKSGVAHLVVYGGENGTTKTVEALSEGTRDQLYLALRLAGLERHLEEGRPALPFVADDLFVNFDDERAAAGFQALAALASRTQVIYFTHHRHLVDLARTTLGAAVAVETLGA